MNSKTLQAMSSSLVMALAAQHKEVTLYVSEVMERMELLSTVINLLVLGSPEVKLVIKHDLAKQIDMTPENAQAINHDFGYFLVKSEATETTSEADEAIKDYYVWHISGKGEKRG